MIPAFDVHGQHPPGIYKASIDDVVQRFGQGSDARHVCVQSVQWLLPMCRRAGIAQLFINGSFVTECREPQDVDCVLVPGEAFNAESDAALALHIGLPYLSLQIVASNEERDFFVKDAFATDRQGRPKGIVEVAL